MARIGRWAVGFAAAVAMISASSLLRAADEPATPAPSTARPRGGMMGGGLGLLRAEVVVKDLELTDDQNAALKKIGEEARKTMTDMRESLKDASREDRQKKMADAQKEITKKVDAVLNDKQRARLEEIKLQARGPAGLADKELQDKLKLTDDQKSKLTELAEARRKAVREAFQGAAGGDRTEARKKIAEASKESSTKMLDVLTTEQKEAFEKMQGKKIELGSAAFGSFGGPGRRNRDANAKPDSTPNSK
jgi:Spy/CpxP family protein refolding chaperone